MYILKVIIQSRFWLLVTMLSLLTNDKLCWLYGGVKRPHPTIHSRHFYKTRVTSTNQPSRLQFTTCFVDVTAVNCRVWPFHAIVWLPMVVLSVGYPTRAARLPVNSSVVTGQLVIRSTRHAVDSSQRGGQLVTSKHQSRTANNVLVPPPNFLAVVFKKQKKIHSK